MNMNLTPLSIYTIILSICSILSGYFIYRRKQAELALQEQDALHTAVLDNIPHPVYFRDTQQRLTHCNKAYEEAVGAAKDVLIGTRPCDLHPYLQVMDDLPEIEQTYRELLQANKTIRSTRIIRIQGEKRHIHNWVARMHNQKSEVTGLTGGWVDMTDLVAVLDALRHAQTTADNANRTKSLFLTTLSHELRTPMNALLGILELLSMNPTLSTREKMLIDTAYGSATSLLTLIDDVLDLSKLEVGQFTIRPEPVNLHQLIAESIHMFQSSASRSCLYLTSHIDQQVWTSHLADPARIRQIMNNLLSNALKFTQAGGVDVRLDVVKHDRASQTLRLTITDTGMGIAQDEQALLFTPFSQAKSTASRVSGGTGLGLSICRKLAHLMQGDITLQSTTGIGTTVEISLQLPHAEAPVRPRLAITPDPHALACPSSSQILIIDDHQPNRLVLLEQLRHLGCDVVEADNAMQALDACQQQKFDLIFCDCKMPGMDGYQFTRTLRHGVHGCHNRDTPVLGYTANATPEVHAHALRSGMQQCLNKPLGMDTLQRTLLHYLAMATMLYQSTDHADNIDTDQDKPYDPDKLLTLTLGKKENEHKLLSSLLTCNEEDWKTLTSAAHAHDWQTVAAHAHRIKGAADLVGATQLHLACVQVEHGCTQAQSICQKDIDALCHCLASVQQELRTLLEKHHPVVPHRTH